MYVDLVSENLFSWSSSDENCFTAIQLKELTVLLWVRSFLSCTLIITRDGHYCFVLNSCVKH